MLTGIAAFSAFYLSGPAEAQPADVAAAIAAKDRPETDRRMDAARRPVEVLAFLRLTSGDQVLDVFANPGFYTEIIARAVGPSGHVVAYDPPQCVAPAASRANWRSRLRRLPNVSQLLQPLHDVRLPPDRFDLVLLHLAYHETYWQSDRYGLKRMDPVAFARRIYKATKPGGRVGVIDHIADANKDTRATVDKYHRIDPAVVIADFRNAGFTFEGESPALRVNDDNHRLSVFDPRVRGRTDRAVLMFIKPTNTAPDARAQRTKSIE